MRRLALLFLIAGCGNSSHSVSMDLATNKMDLSMMTLHDLATSPDLLPSSSYPAGPYGNQVGDTIPPLVWEGYDDPLADAIATSKPFGAYSMNDLRMSGRPYAAVHVAEFF